MFSKKFNALKVESLLFRLYDSNSDGHIDFKDLVTVAYAISEGTEDEKLKQVNSMNKFYVYLNFNYLHQGRKKCIKFNVSVKVMNLFADVPSL